MRRPAAAIAVVAALALATFAVVRGTWAVGGSDSSCYALMADAFSRGEVQPAFPLALRAPWSDRTQTFAPGGFIASPIRPGAASPICTPGFSLLLTPFRWLGGRDGIFLVTPVAAALLVWCVFLVARQLAGDSAGALAAVVIATTPIVLFQAVQPMNDITTAALWAATLAAAGATPRRWGLAGALTGAALLVRPNLAPVAVVVGSWVVVMSRSRAAVVAFGVAACPGVATVLLFNDILYGSPFSLGYGSAADLFSVSHIVVNLAQYSRAALETLTPLPLLALAAPFVVRRAQRPLVWLAIGVIAATAAVYLTYRPFNEWWYLRFLLPAIVAAVVLASAVVALVVRRPAFVAVIAVAFAAFGVQVARERQAFDLERLESRFRETGAVVRARLPENALLFTVWQSGTIRYHANREAIVWDALEPAALDAAVDWTRAEGYEPFLLLERWEEPQFRERFSDRSALGALDWPPRLEIDRQVRIYAPSDRAAYISGRPVPTEHVFPRSPSE